VSLLSDIQKWYEEEAYPPDGSFGAVQVAYEYGDSRRWGQEFTAVYERDGEFVAVSDVEPATEMQDWGDYGEPDIYEVRPVEVTVTKYEKV